MSTAYLNGTFMPLEQIKISPLDRGFLFGDGVYEVIPAYNGRLFLIDEHLQRLANSLKAIRLSVEVDWLDILQTLLQHNDGGDKSIYLQVTRGVETKRTHKLPTDIEPTVFAFATPLQPPDFEKLSAGASATTLTDTRWQHCHIKAITLLPNVLLNQAAQDAGYNEAILINDGYAIEGTASNLFLVRDGVLITTPMCSQILGGITRDLIIQLARKHNLPVEERMILTEELSHADEIWLSGSIKEICPIITLNDQAVGNGRAGPYWQKMIKYYQDYKQHFAYD